MIGDTILETIDQSSPVGAATYCPYRGLQRGMAIVRAVRIEAPSTEGSDL